ncbi:MULTISPECIES: type I-F CRISPR-associated protein Csy2 [unclassified Neptuniibacter]|uniref:type I-F CRISPR-associated protein Csy2 n=1 Tax=unclassified Neptuniibacter TaxID=2630693 RepID=UPI000C535766|nr:MULTISPECIES: type I-F CRISPR-associated protein Csy2 [unclassified Neptuniibacter]MAY42620.1 type I-F CRISPR-associated protein Csy2 [Oceanospirillaceae bacterium]
MSNTQYLLALPRLRIQHANCISSPLTWGFPSMSAFVGWMQALIRKLPEHLDLEFDAVGIICHQHELQTDKDYVHRFNLTRNPVDKSGKTAAIVEEGRIHLEVTLLLSASGSSCLGSDEDRQKVADEVADLVAGMRIAGGSVLASSASPQLLMFSEDDEKQSVLFRRLRYQWLPGFALVLRDDLLQGHCEAMRSVKPKTTLLDAWLDLSRFNHECVEVDAEKEEPSFEWKVRQKPGWLVPLPVGYGALSQLYEPGQVAKTRDSETPFRFVETLYSMGQWVSPHRINSIDEIMWYVHNDEEQGLYRLNNDYADLAAKANEKGIE